MSSGKSRSFCFTVFKQFSLEDIKGKFADAEYYVFGEEICPTTGQSHLQCFVYFKNPRSEKAIWKIIPGVHVEPCKGSPEQNSAYCKKENKFIEKGTCPAQGKRSDIDYVRDVIKETNSMRRVVEVATSYQAVKMAEVILKYQEPGRNWLPEVYWFYGPTGCGKTRLAQEILGDDYYTCMGTGKWFEGYDAHENVLIDDLRGDFMKFHELLRLLDRYPFRVETKGGSRQFLAKKIIITCPRPPEEIFPQKVINEDIGQLFRRIKQIIEFPAKYNKKFFHKYILPLSLAKYKI